MNFIEYKITIAYALERLSLFFALRELICDSSLCVQVNSHIGEKREIL